MELSAYLPVFVDEARKILQHLDENLLELEKNTLAEKNETIQEIYRGLHTLKGMAATMELSAMERLTHELENFLEKGEGKLQPLFLGVDTLGRMLENIDTFSSKIADPLASLEGVFQRFPRLVRDMSRSLGKEVELVRESGAIELDRRLVDELGFILVHLVRNAVDHALELPEERLGKGKERAGQLRLGVRCEGDRTLIEVSDDGRGFEPEVLKARAVACGRLSPEQAAGLSEQQAIELSFLPGLSTRERVEVFSGRGMGLDIVRGRLAALGGFVEISSVAGEGAAVTLSLPSTPFHVSKDTRTKGLPRLQGDDSDDFLD